MKILQIIPFFCYGGAETMCENLTRELARAGHQVVVVNLYNRPTPISQRLEAEGIRLYFLDKKLGLDLSMVPQLMNIMKQERPDVVHTHLDVIKYAALAAKLSGVSRCVHTVHNVAQEEAEGKLQVITNWLYFHLGWAVPVALSQTVQQTIAQLYRLSLRKIPIIFNGVDLSGCTPKTDYDLSEPPVLVHVGRFNRQKNHACLLEGFRRLLALHSTCRLGLIGEGEEQPAIARLAAELGIENQVDFLGSLPDVRPVLSKCDIFVLPSLYEGMPMTILEAMGTGLPVVASAVGGVPDMLRQEETGLLIAPDPEQLCQACHRLLTSRQLRQKLGTGALADSSRFSAAFMARQYARVYQEGGMDRG